MAKPTAGSGRRIFLGAFLGAALFYVLAYAGLEWVRSRKGPWVVSFECLPQGPRLTINQHRLGITNVHIQLPPTASQGTNTGWPQTRAFSNAQPVPFPVPFGQCVFLDTTFLPGTVTMQIAGHELELLPRVLVVNHAPHTWSNHTVLQLDTAPPQR